MRTFHGNVNFRLTAFLEVRMEHPASSASIGRRAPAQAPVGIRDSVRFTAETRCPTMAQNGMSGGSDQQRISSRP
jgi:hypothetical protein